MNHEITHTTAYLLVITFAIIMLTTIPISEFLAKKLYGNKKIRNIKINRDCSINI